MGIRMGVMLDWIKKRRSPADHPSMKVDPPKRPGRAMSGQYLLLYNYLENRYADTVVLTFSEIEDLLGFPLPEQARLHREWWLDQAVGTGANHADSWILASRTAIPDLTAKTVVFDRRH
jgi:hypothetical protein